MVASDEATCELAVDGEAVSLTLRGNVGLLVADQLHACARQALSEPALEVDLSEARHLDTSAWQILLALVRGRRKTGRTTRIVNVPASIESFLHLGGLAPEFEACR